jgi:uncharacterized protein (DUF58 family)
MQTPFIAAVNAIPVPTRRLLGVLACVLVLSIATSFVTIIYEAAWQVWASINGLLLAVAIADAMVTWRRCHEVGAVEIERRVPHTLPVGIATQVTLKVVNRSARQVSLLVADLHPVQSTAEAMPVQVVIPSGRFVVLQYQLTASVRGDLQFAGTAIRRDSPLGLWQMTMRLPNAEAVRAYPNYAAVTRYALLAVDHRLSQIGVLKRRRRGAGMDFHQLRDYRDGDSPRAIDWKATSRRVRLISREYQDERDQQVLFLLDCSRRMNAKDDVLSHFDHTLNAILLMTFVAIRQGDAAGLMTFGGETGVAERFLAPKKSAETMSRFLNALYPLQPSLKTPDYYQAALDVGRRLNKRALIVVISNLRDEDEDGLDVALAQLKRRHLVLFANLKEKVIEDALHRPRQQAAGVGLRASASTGAERSDVALLDHAAALRYAAEREAVLAKMRARGVRVLDVLPEQLPIALVNRYLDLKQSGVL